jgi:tyrosinase
MRRDVHPGIAAFTKANITSALIADSHNIEEFQDELEKPMGVHAAGHLTIGGDPGGDFFVGASDPLFFLHHGEIDRVYWTWQNHGLPERLNAVAGTITSFNQPPSRNGTLDDIVDLGNLAGPKPTLRDLMSTTGGLRGYFCYVYAQ